MIRSAFLLLAFCIVHRSAAQTAEQTFSTQLNEYLQSINKPDEPGMAVLVAIPNKKVIFSKGYGLADMVMKTPITPNTVFNLGSVSKTFVAYGILKLQEEGKLSINDPITKYFPQFKDKELVKNIQIRHLLTHTSGLPDIRPVSRDSVFYLTANDAQNWAPILENKTLHFQPGEQYEYSNPAFNGLALIIEKVTGRKWQSYIEQLIFKPAGMRNSVITDIEYPQLGVAHGYQWNNGQWQEYDFGEYPTFCAAGNGGVWSSVEELLRYEEAIQKHHFVKKETVDFSRSVFQPANWKGKETPFIGYSWFIRQENGVKEIGHSGDQGGFRAEHWMLPDQQVFIAVIGNGNKELDDVRKKIIELLQSNKITGVEK